MLSEALDPFGTTLFARKIDLGAPNAAKLAVGDDGRTLTVRAISAPSSGVTGLVLTSKDAAGAPLWEKSFPDLGFSATGVSRAATLDASGRAVIAGSYEGAPDLGNGRPDRNAVETLGGGPPHLLLEDPPVLVGPSGGGRAYRLVGHGRPMRLEGRPEYRSPDEEQNGHRAEEGAVLEHLLWL